jgi:hypothetical protein
MEWVIDGVGSDLNSISWVLDSNGELGLSFNSKGKVSFRSDCGDTGLIVE